MRENAFFRVDDPKPETIAGIHVKSGGGWWSRRYEYAWAWQYAPAGGIAADMGCGWNYRPFKDMLASRCRLVFAVDHDKLLLDLPGVDNVTLLCADLRATGLESASLDAIFCLSVLEHVSPKSWPTIFLEFARVLKPAALAVLTVDVEVRPRAGASQWVGTDLSLLFAAAAAAGLTAREPLDLMGDPATGELEELAHLGVFHFVLGKAR